MSILAFLLQSEVTFLGGNLFSAIDFYELLFRFGMNIIVTGLIIRILYFKQARRKDYLFTYFMVSVVVFFLCIMLNNVKLQIGFALGLFAIFGILRYRTDAIPIKEMTYLFIVIGISVINALTNKKVSYAELAFTNISILGLTYLLEYVWLMKHETRKVIMYEKIELIKPEKKNELLRDLEKRTGLKILRVEIGKIDFLRDTAEVIIYFNDKHNNSHITDDCQTDRPDDDD